MHHILQRAGLFIVGQVYFQKMLRESVSHSLVSFVWSSSGVGGGGDGWDEGLWLNIISRCAFEHESTALFFTLSVIIPASSICLRSRKFQRIYFRAVVVFFSSLGDFRQRLTGRASGLMCSCAFVSVHRMWRQPAGQQREFFLSWIPKWILGLHALHLENISHTGGKGTSLRKVSDLCLKAPQIKSLAPSCWCSLLVSSYLSEI